MRPRPVKIPSAVPYPGHGLGLSRFVTILIVTGEPLVGAGQPGISDRQRVRTQAGRAPLTKA